MKLISLQRARPSPILSDLFSPRHRGRVGASRKFRGLSAVLVAAIALSRGSAQTDSLSGLTPKSANWQLGSSIVGDPRHEHALTAAPGSTLLFNNPGRSTEPLSSAWLHSDLDLDLDFLLTPGAGSALCFQGLYRLELKDSWGARELTPSDCGGIANHAPLANACRAPGLWQHLHVEFKGPQFDSQGRKTANARFAKVLLNGYLIQENVEVDHPSSGAPQSVEKPSGPLVILGNIGPIAIRAVHADMLDPRAKVKVTSLTYQIYEGEFANFGDYREKPPSSSGTPTSFALSAVEKTGRYALVFTGSLEIPRASDYTFSTNANDPVRLSIDDQLVISPSDRGGEPGTLHLTEGSHALRLDYLRNRAGGRPSLEVNVRALGVPAQPLTSLEKVTANPPHVIPIEPTDRILLQRSFVPFEPKKKLYAASVGSPTGVHFSYDFETGTILRIWRGGFLDAVEMWEGRGESQLAKPKGSFITLNSNPTVALLEFSRTSEWPDQPDALFSSQGYRLEKNGQPVFFSTLAGLTIQDRVAAQANGAGLSRTMNFGGKLADWETWILLAEAETITAQKEGKGWIVGDRNYYVDWPDHSAFDPIIQTRGGRQQLVVHLSKSLLSAPLIYNLTW